jgi:hypothetical protein
MIRAAVSLSTRAAARRVVGFGRDGEAQFATQREHDVALAQRLALDRLKAEPAREAQPVSSRTRSSARTLMRQITAMVSWLIGSRHAQRELAWPRGSLGRQRQAQNDDSQYLLAKPPKEGVMTDLYA